MRRHATRGGWTLIELLVATVSAAVLALTVGTMLVYTIRAWQRHLALTDMQGDVRVVVPTLCMAIREARNSDVVAPAVGVTSAQLTLGRRSFYRATSALAYSTNGTTLAHDPDTNTVNNTVALIRGRVAAFQCQHSTNSVTFNLILREQGVTMSVTNEVFFRN